MRRSSRIAKPLKGSDKKRKHAVDASATFDIKFEYMLNGEEPTEAKKVVTVDILHAAGNREQLAQGIRAVLGGIGRDFTKELVVHAAPDSYDALDVYQYRGWLISWEGVEFPLFWDAEQGYCHMDLLMEKASPSLVKDFLNGVTRVALREEPGRERGFTDEENECFKAGKAWVLMCVGVSDDFAQMWRSFVDSLPNVIGHDATTNATSKRSK